MTLNQTLISETTLTVATASITIAVPSGYTDIKLVMSARGTSSNTNYDPFGFKINGSLPTASYKSLGGTGSTSATYGASSETFTASTAGGTWARVTNTGVQPGGSAADLFSTSEMQIFNYLSTGTKNYSYDHAIENNAAAAHMEFTSGAIATTSAITSISFACRDGNFAAGSSFTLYGVTKLGITPTVYPKATGGDIIKNDGTYWYHAFLSSGMFIPTTNITCDYFVVGAGGGGAGGVQGSRAGGGGGGGYTALVTSSALLSNTVYLATIGSGGTTATAGTSSSFRTTTANGGSGGSGQNGGAGGSGGGAGLNSNAGYYGGAGGTNGGNGNTATNGSGSGGTGQGTTTYNTWNGNVYYGAGGGGGTYGYGFGGGAGGATGGGGGGNGAGGSSGQIGSNGLNGTGAGGGGAGSDSAGASGTGGTGGSGVVIIRYAMA